MLLYNCAQCGGHVEHTGYSGRIGFTCRACALAPVETACEACTRYRERIATLEAELAERQAQLHAIFWSHQERVDGLNADRDEARALVDLAIALLLAGGCSSSAVTLARRRPWATAADLADVSSRAGVSRES